MKPSGLFLILSLLFFPVSNASAGGPGKRELPARRHELFAGTAMPGRYNISGYVYDGASFDAFSIPGIYRSSKYYEKEFTTGAWSLGYTYRFTKVLAIQASVFYEAGWVQNYDRTTRLQAGRSLDSYLTAMASFKVYWYNRPIVRMYSYLGLGLAYNHKLCDPAGEPGHGTKMDSAVMSYQLTPLGIQIGRRFFGFAEIGGGNYCSGFAVGAGYCF